MNPTMTHWREQGYAICRGVFDPERCRRMRSITEKVWQQCMIRDMASGNPGGGQDMTFMFHPNHPDYFRGAPDDLRDLLESGGHQRVRDFARDLHGEDPLYYSNSLWFNPTGTSRDGNWHRDTQFNFPDEAEERARFAACSQDFGNGVQIQIALVPSDDVEFVPGSHLRWDTPPENRIRRSENQKHWLSNDMPGAVRIALQAGDAVALNPNGLHRGRYHVDKLRRTFTVTITKESKPDCNSFTRQPWFLKPGYLDGQSPSATAWYRRFIGTYRHSWSIAAPAVDPNTGMYNVPAIPAEQPDTVSAH